MSRKQQTANIGLDYSLGQSNFDLENGVHFGVISQNSINLDCLDSAEYDYGEPHCPECGNEIKASDDETLFEDFEGEDDDNGNESELDPDGTPAWFDGKDFACLDCKKCWWSEACFPDESIGWSLDDGEYKLTDCLDTDIFVLKSPYYTHAQFCSPCVPGAGNLDTPTGLDGPKTYCLGHDWFDGETAPYTVYRVADGSVVEVTHAA